MKGCNYAFKPSRLSIIRRKKDIMNNNTKRFVAITGIGLALMMPINRTFGDERSELFAKLSAEWWQWALSIPTSVNPQLDITDGKNAVVGQRGPVWFLAGIWDPANNGHTATRTCSVPQGTAFFFPVINGVGINAPVCGGPPESVNDVRKDAAMGVDGAANLSVTLDGVAIKIPPRVQSKVFAVALPKDNVFGLPCLLPGIYSPAAGDGFYVLLGPLSVGGHTLHFHAENPAGTVNQDVTYHLTVVPVLLK
jgi:hypothetical protein